MNRETFALILISIAIAMYVKKIEKCPKSMRLRRPILLTVHKETIEATNYVVAKM